MPSTFSPLAGAVSDPVCSNAVEHSNGTVILTKQQAAEYLQVTPRYLEKVVRSGRLRACKPTGKLWRVRRSDLEAFLESGASILKGRPAQ
jgi:excisionase family DNA binding protein